MASTKVPGMARASLTRPPASPREVFFSTAATRKSGAATEVGALRDSARQQRRARRWRGFLSARDGRIAARLARVDYKIASESGALTPPLKTRVWHRNGRLNGHAPPPGRAWDRAGPTRVVKREDGPMANNTTA